ncbi:MAG: ParB/RepB/Spo0J family partition protein [Marmoricola sp.]|jgi:ParB family chromosome partitioning protein|nr:ParB/RepB/Spo0J family partition protein [Marmoricola sp.]MCW2837157.1 ParB/RepB/Spo0J family partition protein [Marmoricola sp.]
MNTNQPAPRRGLGRGLGSLIPTGPTEQTRSRSGDTASPVPGGYVGSHAAGPGAPGSAAGSLDGPSGVDGSAGGDGSTSNGAAAATQRAGGATATLTEERPAEVPGAYFAELPTTSITPNSRQPRQVFEEEAMAELVHSVKEVGLLQPVVVRRTGDSSYELIMGERRWRAVQQAGLDTIPAIVRQTGDDDMLRDALLENLHRSELNPLEEAAAYRQLLDDFGCTHDELAGRIGRSRPQISNTLRLLNLSPAVQRRVAAGVLSAGHARALLGVTDSAAQDRLAGRVVSEGISVRGLEELVSVGELGEDDDQPRVRPARPTAPGLAELGDRLSDRLDTRVKVTLGRSKGKVAIEFASLTDLERIVAVIDPRNRDDRPI